jgi:DNA-directed RNA polymerase specialized sigma24 family protein
MILLALYATALRSLSHREQAALELVEVEERTYADSARILRVGRSNMKMIVFRARKRIRAEIGRRLAQSAPVPSN